MMTFIVAADFVLNAHLLDDLRLGKQRIEARQILDAILIGTSWSKHPIVHAWRPFVNALKYYTNCVILEWIRRGGQNNLPLFDIPELILLPWWSQWDRLHQSHRAMLIRKDPFFYHDKFTIDQEYYSYGYIWPHNIPYENRDYPLHEITAPIPKELINPIYCQSILKSGKRTGQTCNRLVKTKTSSTRPYCATHIKSHTN